MASVDTASSVENQNIPSEFNQNEQKIPEQNDLKYSTEETPASRKSTHDHELLLKLDKLLIDDPNDSDIYFHSYKSELEMPSVMSLISATLSEPYSIYTYRYFIHNWPELCFLCSNRETNELIGAIVSKLDLHKKISNRGYIAMLAINKEYRRKKLASKLVLMSIREMIRRGCDEIVLEAEVTNDAALHLYENLGFLREKRLYRYYLNGVDAYRLKLWLK